MYSARSKWFVLCTSVAVVLAIACNDGGSSPPPLTGPPVSSLAPRGSRGNSFDKLAARRAAHENNPMDWVGVAHNRALDDYFHGMKAGKASRDACHDLVDFMSDEARTPGHGRLMRSDRRVLARGTLQVQGYCLNQVGSASESYPALLAQATTTTVSPATQSMLWRINDAIAGSVDSYELAYRINMMYGEIWLLPGDEAAATYSVASIAVSSAEYWETHMDAVYSDLLAAYGSCMTSGAYSSAENASEACMGLRVSGYSGPAPTLERGHAKSPILQLTQGIYKDDKCSYFDTRKNVENDFIGGAAGAFLGAATGVVAGIIGTAGILAPEGGLGGAAAGAVAGAGVTSAASFMFQFGESLFCTYVGGGGPKTRPSPT
jgi:hypothetical protein